MDRVEFSNNLMDLRYTEMWVPVELAEKTVNLMQRFYEQGGYAATGFYTVELLGSPASLFWLSPGYQRASIRFNFMWFARGAADPTAYFQKFWDLFRQNDLGFRPHWGKYLPAGDGGEGAAYLRGQYPKWDAFMALRKQMDPDNIFLSTYWKKQLDIQ